ncbi:SubName: Full=Uncharacterized protein {ECO:0000313/EMBL:CCA76344.1} [Serendipita indica DSM 11827]|uniref:Uncharacterized protein n=1 Tax=Serendipita indica (strain DSM 11827) TaxID=1109443 RepID=G4TYF1_SERID|nr:SubName: Full=Uncharacterized protein {ECO:0000313/EMBL:CCA76344.1} [Serendipita indica DSM 11827]CCA76344.1 hypothetical protein PIIN_10339 [Serendipita indica DSM 11827]
MPIDITAASRIPVEIWDHIMGFCLGLPLAEADQPSLRAYRLLFSSESELLMRYMSKERIRSRLRLVCQTWKALADKMGDKIVVSHLDEYDWPPFRSRQSAMVIYYSRFTRHKPNDPACAYRERLGVEYHSGDAPMIVNVTAPLAPVTMLGISTLQMPPFDVDMEAAIRVLNWGPFADINTLLHPTFRNLKVLRLWTYYPFQPVNSAQELTLPQLRCLFLYASVDATAHSTESSCLAPWTFPLLKMFEFGTFNWGSMPADDLVAFVNKHSQSLEELAVVGPASIPFIDSADWSRFHRLKTIRMPNLGWLILLLPRMEQFWKSDSADASGYPVGRLVEVELTHVAIRMERGAAAESLEKYHWMLKHAKIVLCYEWGGIMDRISHPVPIFLIGVRDFFDLVEEFGLNVVDSNGHSLRSNVAITARMDVVDYLDDYNAYL